MADNLEIEILNYYFFKETYITKFYALSFYIEKDD
jgi:hypothetical protein